jgi:hypothetical protein
MLDVNILMSKSNGEDKFGTKCPDAIRRCLVKKTGLYPEEIPIEDDPFEREEVQDLQELLSKTKAPCTAE